MESTSREKAIIGNQWKLVPKKRFLHTLGVGQYIFSRRSSSEVVAAKADEKFYEIAAELNRSIDKLLYQPGGGDHPALDWIWERLDRKLIKEFDLYMKVVDKSQILSLPKNSSVLDITPAPGLIYSKIVEVPLNTGISPHSCPQAVTVRLEEQMENVEMEEQAQDEDQHIEQGGEGVSQANVESGLEQDGKGGPQPIPKANVDSGLEQGGTEDLQPHPKVNEDSGLEQDGEKDSQLEPRVNGISRLTPEVGTGGSGLRSKGIQKTHVEQNSQIQTPKCSEVVRLIECYIKMPRLEDMIDPEAMAIYWRKYNESGKLKADIGFLNQPLKPILKSKPMQVCQKKSVRFQVTDEMTTLSCVQSLKQRRKKNKLKIKFEGVLTRSSHKKREEMKKTVLQWNSTAA